LKYGDAAPNPFEIIYIDPSNINRFSLRKYQVHNDRFKDLGTVEEGDWDTRSRADIKTEYENKNNLDSFNFFMKNEFSETPFHLSMKKHFEDGKHWEETPYYTYLKKKKLNRLSKVDKLYNSIEENGIVKASEIEENNSLLQKLDDIMIDIGRNGDTIMVENRHRLSIAKILDIEKVPVRVVCRHKKWQEKRTRASNSEEKIKKLEDHPDLRNNL